MQKYSRKLNAYGRIRWGMERIISLMQFDATRPLAAPFQAQNDDLRAKHEARVKAEEAMLPARVQYRFAEYRNDKTIKGLNHAAAAHDGNRTGPTVRSLFPNGATEVVIVSGPTQLAATDALINRFQASNEAGVVKLREEWMPKVKTVRDELALSLAAREAAYNVLSVARANEEAAKRDHETAVERLLGEVRAATAGDKALQDAIFPSVSDASTEVPEAAEPADSNKD